MKPVRSLAALGAAALLFAGCQDTSSTAPVRAIRVAGPSLSVTAETGVYSPELDQIRQKFSAQGVPNVELATAEISVAADSTGWQGATTLYANDRTHRFPSAFVPSDPRRGGSPDITYIVDQAHEVAASRSATSSFFVLRKAELEPEIDASMLRWQNQPSCGGPRVSKIAYTGADPDLLDGIILGIPSLIGTPSADIVQGGWLPPAFFDALAKNGSQFILGVTMSYVFTDANHNPTDIDRDGHADAAFREIYYNQNFYWTTDPAFLGGVDVQTVVTHESGHAYGLGHFGKVFEDKMGVIHYAPRAVMTAVYVSSFRDLTGTDNSSFCQLWANAK